VSTASTATGRPTDIGRERHCRRRRRENASSDGLRSATFLAAEPRGTDSKSSHSNIPSRGPSSPAGISSPSFASLGEDLLRRSRCSTASCTTFLVAVEREVVALRGDVGLGRRSSAAVRGRSRSGRRSIRPARQQSGRCSWRGRPRRRGAAHRPSLSYRKQRRAAVVEISHRLERRRTRLWAVPPELVFVKSRNRRWQPPRRD
jgi:hypothetical protein